MAGPIIKTRGRNRSDKIEREILDFIKRFEAGTDMFLHGCCYWFTHILSERFWLRESVAILYEPVEERPNPIVIFWIFTIFSYSSIDFSSENRYNLSVSRSKPA